MAGPAHSQGTGRSSWHCACRLTVVNLTLNMQDFALIARACLELAPSPSCPSHPKEQQRWGKAFSTSVGCYSLLLIAVWSQRDAVPECLHYPILHESFRDQRRRLKWCLPPADPTGDFKEFRWVGDKIKALPETQHLANPHGMVAHRSPLKVSNVFWGMLLNLHMPILISVYLA